MNGDGEEEDEQADDERYDVHFKSDVFIAYRAPKKKGQSAAGTDPR
jgi:hypothetical protein